MYVKGYLSELSWLDIVTLYLDVSAGERYKDGRADRKTVRGTGRQTHRQADRQTDKQTDRQTNRQTYRHRHNYLFDGFELSMNSRLNFLTMFAHNRLPKLVVGTPSTWLNK